MYHELRGVMLECERSIHRDIELVAELGAEILPATRSPAGSSRRRSCRRRSRAMVSPRRRRKRVGARVLSSGAAASWDHRKLGGALY